MAKTANLGLPLISPAQAQKHVMVNEAFVRMDAATQMSVLAADISDPPDLAENGVGYIVPELAGGAWAGRAGQIAVWSNGGWVYLAPAPGWRAWLVAKSSALMYDGTSWVPDAVAVSSGGAFTTNEILEFDQELGAGTAVGTEVRIPANSLVLGITGRVMDSLTGTLTSWRLGVAGSEDRYGKGMGVGAGSFLVGLSGTPVTYYADTSLLIGAEGGAFGGGRIRLAVHLTRLGAPRASRALPAG